MTLMKGSWNSKVTCVLFLLQIWILYQVIPISVALHNIHNFVQEEMRLHILSYLLPTELCIICRVNRQFKSLSEDDRLWIPKCKRELLHIFNNPSTNNWLELYNCDLIVTNWKHLYVKEIGRWYHFRRLIDWDQWSNGRVQQDKSLQK